MELNQHVRFWLNYRRHSAIIAKIEGENITLKYTLSKKPGSWREVVVKLEDVITSNIINQSYLGRG